MLCFDQRGPFSFVLPSSDGAADQGDQAKTISNEVEPWPKLVGVAVSGNKISEIQSMIQRAEELGIHAAWMTTGGARLDSITCFAASAAATERIKLGTSIVPTYPRHPPGNGATDPGSGPTGAWPFRLGVGPSHRPTIEAMGLDFDAPLGHLKEYLRILKAIPPRGTGRLRRRVLPSP